MARSQNWYADGTFKTTLFQQVYTIHLRQHDTIMHAVFVLMTERSTSTLAYVRLLTEVKNIRPDLNSLKVTTDFEQSSLLAFRTIFKKAD